MTEKYTPLIGTLDNILAEAQKTDLPDLIGIAERFVAFAKLKLNSLHIPQSDQPVNQSDRGRYITAEEAGQLFGMDPRWFYRHKSKLPHIQPSRKVVRFHEGKLRKHFSNKP